MNPEINKINFLSRLNEIGTSYYFSTEPFNQIIIPINQIKSTEEKKMIYKRLSEYYRNIEGGRFTEFLSKFYREEGEK